MLNNEASLGEVVMVTSSQVVLRASGACRSALEVVGPRNIIDSLVTPQQLSHLTAAVRGFYGSATYARDPKNSSQGIITVTMARGGDRLEMAPSVILWFARRGVTVTNLLSTKRQRKAA